MPTYNEYGEPVETDEERRKRLEREAAYGAAQDAEDASMGAAMTANTNAGGGFMDAVGNYAQQRFDRAVQPFTDPTAALNRRMGMTPEDAANTEVQSTQVKTYGDGSQEEIVKRQIPAGGAGPVNPADMGAVPQAQPQTQPQTQQKSPEEIARNAQALREMAQGRAAPQAQPTTVPQQLPAQGAIDPNAPMPSIGQVPQPGPGVQVAGGPPGTGVAEAAQAAQAQQPVRPVAPPPTTVTGAAPVGAPAPAPSLAQAGAQAAATPAPAVAPAPAEPAWVAAANAAGSDFGKLIDVAAKFPEARASIQAKLEGVVENSRKANEAQKIVEAAQAGDPKAMNKLEQALRPTRGKEREEVTVGDYLKAYMYARLGLNDLSAEVQAKISGRDTKFGQVTLDGSKWSVETNAKTGEIIRAKDDEGNIATANTINKLKASGLAVTSSTPPSATATRIRDSKGDEWSQVPTPQGMKFFDNNGKQGVPQGRTVPISVGSDLEIAQAKEDMQTVARFGQQTAAARLKAFENTNAKRADRLLPLLSLEEMGLRPDGSLSSENVRRPGAPVAPPAPVAPEVVAPPAPPASVAPPPAPVAPVVKPPVGSTQGTGSSTTPLVSTQGPVAGGGGGGRTSAGKIPTASEMEAQGKEGDLERSVREAQIKDRNKSNQEYSDTLAASRQSAAAQGSTITRLQSSIDKNPEFWGIDTNSGAWRAFVDLNSTNDKKAESLNTLARNLNIPSAKRAQFDQTMNDYRNLQVNAITGSGLSASQTNSEKESQRVVGVVGSISDRPAAAKATLEYAKAKIEYTDAKARAWADARRRNPGIDRLAFEANFDATTGEKIFKDANESMNRILGGGAGGGAVAGTTKTINGVTYVRGSDGRWRTQ